MCTALAVQVEQELWVRAISFASEDDAFLLPDLEQLLGKPITCEPVSETLLEN